MVINLKLTLDSKKKKILAALAEANDQTIEEYVVEQLGEKIQSMLKKTKHNNPTDLKNIRKFLIQSEVIAKKTRKEAIKRGWKSEGDILRMIS